MQLPAAIRRRYSQTGSIKGLAVVLYHALCRKTQSKILGTGKAVTLKLNRAADPFYFRLGTTDFHTALEVLDNGEYSLVLQTVSAASVVVDLGCNIGLSCQLWRRRWPDCVIVAVEPDEDNMRIAKLNTQRVTSPASKSLNRYICAAVSNRRGTASLNRINGAWAYRVDPAGRENDIRLLTMDDVLLQAPGDSPIDLLKCDIEGGEADLFGDLGPWIRRVRHLVVETHVPYDLNRLEADLRSAGISIVPIHTVEKIDRSVGFYKLNH